MFFCLELSILRLPDMLLIDSDTDSEFGFTNSSFTGVFFTTCGANDNIKKIITIARKIVLSTFLNVYELPKSRLAQHTHLFHDIYKLQLVFERTQLWLESF